MILRRITEHVKAQNWFAVILDFVIVVFGVFIGIQVANWNTALADRQTEATYLELLRGDLRSTLSDAEAQVEFEQMQASLANDAAYLVDAAPSEARKQKLAMLLSTLGSRRTLKVDSPTFLDLQSSGKLELISDTEMRNEIVAYFTRIDRLVAVIEINNAAYVDRNFNDFLDQIALGYWVWDDDVMQRRLSDSASESASLVLERLALPLQRAGGSALMSPPDAAIWEQLTARLSARALIAVTNETYAESLLQATSELEEKITAHLEGGR